MHSMRVSVQEMKDSYADADGGKSMFFFCWVGLNFCVVKLHYVLVTFYCQFLFVYGPVLQQLLTKFSTNCKALKIAFVCWHAGSNVTVLHWTNRFLIWNKFVMWNETVPLIFLSFFSSFLFLFFGYHIWNSNTERATISCR